MKLVGIMILLLVAGGYQPMAAQAKRVRLIRSSGWNR